MPVKARPLIIYGAKIMNENEKTCCFTGHRDIPGNEKAEIEKRLEEEVRKLIGDGFTSFAAGGALGFDTMAARMVLKLKEEFKELKLILILPCKDQARKWSAKNAYEYEMIKYYADEIRYIEEKYVNGCYQKRNRALVDASQVCIAYLRDLSSGTAYTCNYAKRRGVRVINLAEEPKNEQISLF